MLETRWMIGEVDPCGFGALAVWLADDNLESSLLAEDVKAILGQFGSMCRPRALDPGIRGLTAGCDPGEPVEGVRTRPWERNRAALYPRVGLTRSCTGPSDR